MPKSSSPTMTATPLTPTNTKLRNLHSLQRYWFYAETLKLLFFKALQGANLGKLSKLDQAGLLLQDHVVYMSYWLGSLYVVIEGYEKLSISDDEIDLLLADSRKGPLKRFRHGTFHYQADYFSAKLLDPFVNHGSLTWAQSLHDRLGPVIQARLTAAGAAPSGGP